MDKVVKRTMYAYDLRPFSHFLLVTKTQMMSVNAKEKLDCQLLSFKKDVNK